MTFDNCIHALNNPTKNIKHFHQIFFLLFFDLLYLSASFPFLLHGPSSNAYNLIERFGSWSSSHCTVVIPEKYGFPLDFNYWNVVDPINYISSLELSPKYVLFFKKCIYWSIFNLKVCVNFYCITNILSYIASASPTLPVHLSPLSLSLGNHQSILYVYESVSVS